MRPRPPHFSPERGSASPMSRVFFAVWPDAPTRNALDALSRAYAARTGGRAAVASNLHLTLAFVGEVATCRVTALQEAGLAATAAEVPFTLTLDRIGAFQQRRHHLDWHLDAAAGARAARAAIERRTRERRISDREPGIPAACHAGTPLPPGRRRRTRGADRMAGRERRAERVGVVAWRRAVSRARGVAAELPGARRLGAVQLRCATASAVGHPRISGRDRYRAAGSATRAPCGRHPESAAWARWGHRRDPDARADLAVSQIRRSCQDRNPDPTRIRSRTRNRTRRTPAVRRHTEVLAAENTG